MKRSDFVAAQFNFALWRAIRTVDVAALTALNKYGVELRDELSRMRFDENLQAFRVENQSRILTAN